MGYWAKDGAYVHEPGDDQPIWTQKDEWEASQRNIAAMNAYAKKQEEQREAEKEFRANFAQREREVQHEKAIEAEKAMADQRRADNVERYGVNFDLRHPETLGDRRARANYWMRYNNFTLFINTVTGKKRKFMQLWDQFSQAQTEEEKQEIVEKMEAMFPTKDSAVRKVEKAQLGGR